MDTLTRSSWFRRGWVFPWSSYRLDDLAFHLKILIVFDQINPQSLFRRSWNICNLRWLVVHRNHIEFLLGYHYWYFYWHNQDKSTLSWCYCSTFSETCSWNPCTRTIYDLNFSWNSSWNYLCGRWCWMLFGSEGIQACHWKFSWGSSFLWLWWSCLCRNRLHWSVF